MTVSRFIKRFFFAIVLCLVALWCFVRSPLVGYVPSSPGDRIWVYMLLSFGVLAVAWALYLFISTIRMTIKATTPPTPSNDPQLLTREEQEKYTQALQAVDANPQSFEAWVTLGQLEHKLGRNDDALEAANEAIEIISENKLLDEDNRKKAFSRAWMVRGAALSTMDGKEVEALAALDVALENDQNNVDALYYKGRVYTFQELDNDAHRMFDKVLKLKPRYKDALVAKATLYLSPDDFDEDHFNGALDVADKLIARFPEDAVGWRIQGQAFDLQGERVGAKGNLEKGYDLLNEAIASFNKALEIDPTDSNTYFLKAQPYVAVGDYTQALEALNQGLKIDPSNVLLREAKADIVQERTKARTSKIAGRAGNMAFEGGKGLIKGAFRVGGMFKDETFKS